MCEGAGTAYLVGEFNNWDEAATPMKALKSGGFSVTVDLESGQNYQYRFLLDGERWESDDTADAYEFCGYGDCENSVVCCIP
jgi:1,4-alpha-glucan branching enzyme